MRPAPVSQPGPGELLIRTRLTLISTGTELTMLTRARSRLLLGRFYPISQAGRVQQRRPGLASDRAWMPAGSAGESRARPSSAVGRAANRRSAAHPERAAGRGRDVRDARGCRHERLPRRETHLGRERRGLRARSRRPARGPRRPRRRRRADLRDRRYGSVVAFECHEWVAPLAVPESAFPIGEAFPGSLTADR